MVRTLWTLFDERSTRRWTFRYKMIIMILTSRKRCHHNNSKCSLAQVNMRAADLLGSHYWIQWQRWVRCWWWCWWWRWLHRWWCCLYDLLPSIFNSTMIVIGRDKMKSHSFLTAFHPYPSLTLSLPFNHLLLMLPLTQSSLIFISSIDFNLESIF